MGIDYGKGLKKLRKKYGKTQGDLANDTSIAQAYISAIETGRRTPTDETIRKLIEPFGLNYVDFLIDYCGIKRAGAPEGETAAEGRARLDKAEIEHREQEHQDNMLEQITQNGKDLIEEITLILENGSEKEYKLFKGIADYFDTNNKDKDKD